MITKLLYGMGMLIVTLIIQFILYKKGKSVSFWSGMDIVFILCILGLLSNDADDIAGILGFVIGDRIGKHAGWHKYTKAE